jgi:hypothetical protein
MDGWNEGKYPITRFLSETGVESMPSLQTWQQVANASEDRDHHGNGQEQMMFVAKFLYQRFFSKTILDHKLKII